MVVVVLVVGFGDEWLAGDRGTGCATADPEPRAGCGPLLECSLLAGMPRPASDDAFEGPVA
jgi:hypothetical protein